MPVFLLVPVLPAIVGFFASRLLVPVWKLVGIALAVGLTLVLLRAAQWAFWAMRVDALVVMLLVRGLFQAASLLWIGGLGHSIGTVIFHWRVHRRGVMVPLIVYLLASTVFMAG